MMQTLANATCMLRRPGERQRQGRERPNQCEQQQEFGGQAMHAYIERTPGDCEKHSPENDGPQAWAQGMKRRSMFQLDATPCSTIEDQALP
jgi:hypothetical protein